LISFLDELGDRGGALEVYNELATRLRADYDADPSPETQRLINRVRMRTLASGTPEAAVPATKGPDPEVTTIGPDPMRVEAPAGSRHRRARLVVTVLVVAAVVLALAAREGAFRNRPYSIAVVPLQDLSGDTSRTYV